MRTLLQTALVYRLAKYVIKLSIEAGVFNDIKTVVSLAIYDLIFFSVVLFHHWPRKTDEPGQIKLRCLFDSHEIRF